MQRVRQEVNLLPRTVAHLASDGRDFSCERKAANVDANSALLLGDSLVTAIICVKCLGQVGLAHFAVTDEHEPQLVNGNAGACSQDRVPSLG